MRDNVPREEKREAPPESGLYASEPVTTQETTILFDCWRCGCRNKLRLSLTWNGATPRLPKDEVNETK
ncbi:MAG: hypothetical protein ACLP5V_02965 [Candidatus Bathyarchaeia archaeon]